MRSFATSLALGRRELIVVYIMMIVASAIPTMGLGEYLLTIITGAQYFAASSAVDGAARPQCGEVVLRRRSERRRRALGGLGRTAVLFGRADYRPLFGDDFFNGDSAPTWVDRERLIYPLVQVPLQMAENKRGEALGPFFKNPIMWAGFILPVFVSSCNALHAYLNYIPSIQLVSSVPTFRNAVGLIFRLSFPMVGFSYLINLDIAFSLWSFNTIAKLIRGGLSVLGVGSTEKLGIYGAVSEPILAHQGRGH